MNRQGAKYAKKRKREKPKENKPRITETHLLRFLSLSYLGVLGALAVQLIKESKGLLLLIHPGDKTCSLVGVS
ncbi:MAG TPA: hypothetical protein VE999_20870 [Gemmataceae bacterium]|nr:hypothetical protein [Gemmataceae bacterium]